MAASTAPLPVPPTSSVTSTPATKNRAPPISSSRSALSLRACSLRVLLLSAMMAWRSSPASLAMFTYFFVFTNVATSLRNPSGSRSATVRVFGPDAGTSPMPAGASVAMSSVRS